MKLKAGETVTIQVKNPVWPMRKAYASYVQIPEFNTYTGQVILDHKAIKQGQIGLTTDQKDFTMRVIDINRIVGMEDSAPVENAAEEFKTWNVKGSKGNEYVVTLDRGRWSCSCAGFSFRGSCKHVEAARAEVGAGKDQA